MSFTVRTTAGAIIAEALSHSDARLAARSITVAHEIFDPNGVRLGYRPRATATHLDRRQFFAGEHLLGDFDAE